MTSFRSDTLHHHFQMPHIYNEAFFKKEILTKVRKRQEYYKAAATARKQAAGNKPGEKKKRGRKPGPGSKVSARAIKILLLTPPKYYCYRALITSTESESGRGPPLRPGAQGKKILGVRARVSRKDAGGQRQEQEKESAYSTTTTTTTTVSANHTNLMLLFYYYRRMPTCEHRHTRRSKKKTSCQKAYSKRYRTLRDNPILLPQYKHSSRDSSKNSRKARTQTKTMRPQVKNIKPIMLN